MAHFTEPGNDESVSWASELISFYTVQFSYWNRIKSDAVAFIASKWNEVGTYKKHPDVQCSK
jgi:hypothetical protein